jgi:DNA-binding CsgD family transcriptional regulator
MRGIDGRSLVVLSERRRLSSATLALHPRKEERAAGARDDARNARVHEQHKRGSRVPVVGGGITRWVPHGGLCGAPRAARTASLYDIEVLTLVARGLTDRAIGRQLGISEATVKTHLARGFAKLGVTDRTAAVTAALSVGDRPAPREGAAAPPGPARRRRLDAVKNRLG